MTTRNVLDVLTVYDPLSVAESSSCKGRRCESEAQAVAQTGEYEESILAFKQVWWEGAMIVM